MDKTYGGALADEGIFVLANTDGSFVLCVRDSSSGAGDVDVQVIKTDANGGVIWNKTYGGNKKDTDKMIQSTSDGGYIIAAHSRSFGWVNPDFWIIKINSIGDVEWSRHYGGYDHEHCYAVRQTSDAGFIAIGHSESGSKYTEIMFLKLNPIGNLGPLSINEFVLNDGMFIYPNPTDSYINIEVDQMVNAFDMEHATVQISDILGQITQSESITFKNDNKIKIDVKGFSPGIYFLDIQSENNLFTKKIIVK